MTVYQESADRVYELIAQLEQLTMNYSMLNEPTPCDRPDMVKDKDELVTYMAKYDAYIKECNAHSLTRGSLSNRIEYIRKAIAKELPNGLTLLVNGIVYEAMSMQLTTTKLEDYLNPKEEDF